MHTHTSVREAIVESIQRDCIARVVWTEKTEEDLYALSSYEDSVNATPHLIEAWGTNKHGHEWRIELVA